MTIELICAILGWSTLINMTLLIFSSATLIFCSTTIQRVHSKWFGIAEESLKQEYFRYLAHYKILILVFNLVPYLAIRLAMN